MKAKIGDMVKFRKGETIATGKIVAEDENSFGKYFVIKMTGKFKGSGHTCEGIYDTCDYWHAYESMIVSVEPREEIHITRDGDTVHAIMKKDGKVTYRSKAVCSPEDKFNFLVGASMAYARLVESTVDHPQKKFTPHLEGKDSGEHYGIIGSETPLEEATGKKLYVGDLVATIRLKDGKIFNDQEFVVCSNTLNGKKAFVMGIESYCTKTGEIEKYIVVKQKSYKDLYNGQIAGYIKAVLEG